ncbi:pyrimidine/purine nucleoside phosphorylase [Thermithiobacillus plumbiphilus]|uniref:Pyrimidine/purine nucleoside phosphorylase n=1 Tax=Thermithiobacillus plumbiphilus TaxID=1729899 RepID=A0ABU9D786_9PROT
MDDRFSGAHIVKKANVYHNGQCTSRTVITAEGEMKTLGIILPGVYRFSTAAPEQMQILAGRGRYKLADDTEWHEIQTGDTFHVPENASFDIEVTELLDYTCSYGQCGGSGIPV